MKQKIIKKPEQIPAKDEPDPINVTLNEMREGISVTVNPPFRKKQFAANKKLSPEDWEILEEKIPENEQLMFVIVGDLNIGSRYAKSFLAVTDRQIYGFDAAFPESSRKDTLPYRLKPVVCVR